MFARLLGLWRVVLGEFGEKIENPRILSVNRSLPPEPSQPLSFPVAYAVFSKKGRCGFWFLRVHFRFRRTSVATAIAAMITITAIPTYKVVFGASIAG